MIYQRMTGSQQNKKMKNTIKQWDTIVIQAHDQKDRGKTGKHTAKLQTLWATPRLVTISPVLKKNYEDFSRGVQWQMRNDVRQPN